MQASSYFSNRQLLIATKHHKEQVIAPLLTASLGVNPFVAEQLDTDLLGTFSGEVERVHDPLTTLRMKCQLGMNLYQCDLGLATEGSFGPHPSLFFIPANDELIMLIDQKNGFEIVEREISIDTNFRSATLETEAALIDFAHAALFPSHALICRDPTNGQECYKGITDWSVLLRLFHHIQQTYGAVGVETDMRALYNPSRMKVIEKVTQKLLLKINALCPVCQVPGFGVTEAKPGLPCSWCHRPTRSTLSYVYTCSSCQHVEEKYFPHHKQTEDPGYCDYCNP